MSGRLELAVCPTFLGEVRAALATLSPEDVEAVAVSMKCRVNLAAPDARPAPQQHARLWLACSPPPGAIVPPGWTTAAPEQCFHLVAPRTLVASLQRSGAYVVTPGWTTAPAFPTTCCGATAAASACGSPRSWPPARSLERSPWRTTRAPA